jgi:glycosyltransferase involved in cell wall biosynthesis
LRSKITTFVNLQIGAISFFSVFSTGISFRKVTELITEAENNLSIARVIHIHNWYNFLDIKVMKKIAASGLPIVLTLHDERLLTGGCHYALECVGFHSGCLKCPSAEMISRNQIRRNSKTLNDLFSNYPNVFIIAPSKWIALEASYSSQTKFAKIVQIYNVFEPPKAVNSKDQVIGNSTSQAEKNKIYLGVASLDKKSLIKGGDITEKLERYFNDEQINVEITYLSEWLSSGKSFDSFWTQISTILVLSRADNSPNVIHEAKFNNVPVIGSSAGGIPELLRSEFDLIIDDLEAPINCLAERIVNFLETLPDRSHGKTISNFHSTHIGAPVTSHIELYDSIINTCTGNSG